MSLLSLLPVLGLLVAELLVSAFIFTTAFGVLFLVGWSVCVPSPGLMVSWLLLYDIQWGAVGRQAASSRSVNFLIYVFIERDHLYSCTLDINKRNFCMYPALDETLA